MPRLPERKVGLIACSGEELPEGTVSRQAALMVLERLHPGATVTLCLPLFLAGEERERAFARFYPTIAIDGCDKRCAARATEMYSARPAASLVVSDIADALGLARPQRLRGFDVAGEALASAVADQVANQVDELLGTRTQMVAAAQPKATVGGLEPAEAVCSCVSGIPVGNVAVGGRTLELVALPAIFALMWAEGRSPDDSATVDELMEQIRLYNALPPEDEGVLREAVMQEYVRFWAEMARAIGQ
ncbi:MAG: putative zinc-binding protein [Chloroflexota bacterium]